MERPPRTVMTASPNTVEGRSPVPSRTMSIERPTVSAVRGLPPVEQADQLLEQAGDPLGVPAFPGNGDLVASHEHRALERRLDQLEQLVPGAKQAHHRVVARDLDVDLDLSRRFLDLCWLLHAG